jgi:type IX secretion system PorP/SprF family membrane protein
MIMRTLICVILFMTALRTAAQQNVQFSQYIFNGLSVNPAYAGYKEAWYLNTIFRQQWTGLPGAPRTGGVSFDGPLRSDKDKAAMGLGVQVMADMLGPQQAYSVYASYAYSIPLNANRTRHLSVGLGVGAAQYHMDGNALQYFDPEDVVFPAGGVNTITPDARFGIYYHSPSFFISVSALDLFSKYLRSELKYENIKKTMHVYFSTGFMLPISTQVQLKPSIMVKDDMNGPTDVDLNAMLLIDRALWIGGSYRTSVPVRRKPLPTNLDKKNAASVMIEYYINDMYRVGYSYDLPLNELADSKGGSHELSIGILFRKKRISVASPRYF